MNKLSDNTYRKFIDSIDLNEWEIETDEGFSDISSIHKTIEYEVYEIKCENGDSLKCADDHIVFDKNMNEIYVKDCVENSTQIQTKDGISTVKSIKKLNIKDNMYDITVNSNNHRFYTNNILSHNSTTFVAYFLWAILFNPFYKAAIIANKGEVAKLQLARLKTAYEHLPKWIQQGVTEWNKTSIELENGSKVVCAATSSDSVRGSTYNNILLDEFAFVPENVAEDFFRSVYPTISSGKTTKMGIVSTVNGFNKFFKIWDNAQKGKNNYIPYKVNWWEVPGYDEEFKEQTIQNTSQQYWNTEFECQFLGSQNTLISPNKLQNLVIEEPIQEIHIESDFLKMYEKYETGSKYIITVDNAEGVGLDYSVVTVFNVTEYPYKVSAIYRSNMVSPAIFPKVIYNICNVYGNPMVLIESNEIGYSVASDLWNDFEYDNMIFTKNKGRSGQVISGGFGTTSSYGVKMTKSVKRIGCSNLKIIIENDKLIVNDFHIISELSTFISKGTSYEADEGKYDDTVDTLITFSWLINQDYFKDLTNHNLSQKLIQERKEELDKDIMPFFHIDDGTGYNEQQEKINSLIF